MDNVLSWATRDFPEYEVTHLFEAAIPVYFLQLRVEVLEVQNLTAFENYFLHAIALKVNTREQIAHLLGLDDRDLVTPGASLLKRELITQGPPQPSGRPLFLTDKGREFLKTQKVPPAPIQIGAQVLFNTLTWAPIPLDETWSVERMEKEGLCILPPTRQERPTLGDLSTREVASVLRFIPFFQQNQLIKLLELKKASPEYLAPPVTVAVMRMPKQQEQHVALYHEGKLLRNESAVLQRRIETGHFSLPEDAVSFVKEPLRLPTTLPPTVAQVVAHLTDNEARKRKLQEELFISTSRRSTTADQQERRELEDRITQLEQEIRENEEENEKLKMSLQQNQGTFLQTEEHRAFLERIIKEAQEEIIIISPWLNRRTCDDTLCNLFAQAIKRNVSVRIGYGINERPGDLDTERNRANAQKVIGAIRAAVRRDCTEAQASLLDIRRVSDTHEKILICDRTAATLGSFNWLSYRGELDKEYRRETSIVLREPVSVNELARIAMRGFL